MMDIGMYDKIITVKQFHNHLQKNIILLLHLFVKSPIKFPFLSLQPQP